MGIVVHPFPGQKEVPMGDLARVLGNTRYCDILGSLGGQQEPCIPKALGYGLQRQAGANHHLPFVQGFERCPQEKGA